MHARRAEGWLLGCEVVIRLDGLIGGQKSDDLADVGVLQPNYLEHVIGSALSMRRRKDHWSNEVRLEARPGVRPVMTTATVRAANGAAATWMGTAPVIVRVSFCRPQQKLIDSINPCRPTGNNRLGARLASAKAKTAALPSLLTTRELRELLVERQYQAGFRR